MANRELAPWTRGGGATPYARDPFSLFRYEMDRLFDDFFAPAEGRSFAAPRAGEGGAQAMLRPSIDVDESEKAYTVTAELPGLGEDDVELNLAENTLTLSGEKRAEREETEGGRRWTERSYGRFSRTIPFPTEVDADKVEARFKNGVLTVTLPKNEKARDKTRRIEVRADNGGGEAKASDAGQTSAAPGGAAR
jgi:HSP20 family protein